MKRRFDSVDALRGIAVAAMILVNNPGDWRFMYPLLRHARWHGCTLADLVFPLFLFVVRVSLALAVGPKSQDKQDLSPMRQAIMWRGTRIFAVGLLIHLASYWLRDYDSVRLWSVLQRIGLCFSSPAFFLSIPTRVGCWP